MFSKFRLERQPYHRPMSYDSLKSIVPHMELPKRLQLSFLSPIVHGINRRVPFSLSFLKFHQTYSNSECTTGILSVESVEYSFESIGACHVEIRCLGRRRVSREKDVARRYFEYFLRTSVLPVRQLELIHCNTQFHNFHGIPIPRLKLHRHPDSDGTILEFPTEHKMELVELIDSRVEDLEDVNISSAHHIKFSAKLKKHDHYKINSRLMIRAICALSNAKAKAECRIEMNHVESFTFVAGLVLSRRIKFGSYVTGVFEKSLNVDDLHKDLLDMFRRHSPKVTVMNGRECVVLRETENFTSVAIRDYFNTDTVQDCISFTSLNIPKN